MSQHYELIWHSQASIISLDEHLAHFVADRLREALASSGRASLAVSGGRTPTGFLRKLGSMDLDWANVTVTLVDERWVPADHADSNARLVAEALLNGPAAKACFIPLFNDSPSTSEGQARTERQLEKLAWPLDVVVLGMGDDGHTASLFPKAPELDAALGSQAHCIAVTPITAPHARISLTLTAITSARNLLLHITGESKRSVFEAALADTSQDLPIKRVMQAAPLTHVFWAP